MQRVVTGYAETMDQLKRPFDWDVPGLIADICEVASDDEHDFLHGQMLAVVDTLLFRMIDIANATTLDEAKNMAALFVAKE